MAVAAVGRGATRSGAARALGCAPSTVASAVHRYQEEGRQGLKDRRASNGEAKRPQRVGQLGLGGSSVRPIVNPGPYGKSWVVPLAPASIYSWPAQFYLNASVNVSGNTYDEVCAYIIVTTDSATYHNSTSVQCAAGSSDTSQTLTFEKISVPAGGTAYVNAIFYNSVNAWLNSVSPWSPTY